MIVKTALSISQNVSHMRQRPSLLIFVILLVILRQNSEKNIFGKNEPLLEPPESPYSPDQQ